jgi:hypothetical protein
MAVVANQALAFDKSMLTACPHPGDVLRPGLILDHGKPEVLRLSVPIDTQSARTSQYKREVGNSGPTAPNKVVPT